MRVFILSTGRCGSKTIIQACKHITNYTSAHESRTLKIGPDHFNYPDNHIESDNRLSWFLGLLDEKFGDDAFYVHLIRNKTDTVNSFNKRWAKHISINKAFLTGILNTPLEKADKETRYKVSSLYYDTVNANIELFLNDKSNKLTIHLETITEDFELLWHQIKAEGNFKKAIRELEKRYNESGIATTDFKYKIKLWLYSILNK